MIWLGALVCFGLICAFPFFLEAQRKTLTQGDRARSTGQYVQLSCGLTHFDWDGPADGPIIVAVHGLTTPAVVWEDIVPTLTARGFRVLRYDLYGRGFSDAPKCPQTIAFFVNQLHELLIEQDVTAPITLIGYSMGGSIVTAFAAQRPDQVSRLILLASAGVEQTTAWFDRVCSGVPIFGDWVFGTFAAGRMRVGNQRNKSKHITQTQRFQLARRGYLPSVLRSMRGALSEGQEQNHKAVYQAGIPMLAIWGRADRTIPLRAMGVLAKWNRNVEHVDIPDAGHGLPYTHHQSSGAAISAFLKQPLRRL